MDGCRTGCYVRGRRNFSGREHRTKFAVFAGCGQQYVSRICCQLNLRSSMVATNVVHSRALASDVSGELLNFTRDEAGWEWMEFSVRRFAPGESWNQQMTDQESVYVLLGGECLA